MAHIFSGSQFQFCYYLGKESVIVIDCAGQNLDGIGTMSSVTQGWLKYVSDGEGLFGDCQ